MDNCFSADEWDKSVPQSGEAKVDFPDDQNASMEALDRIMSNYREGMKSTYSSATTIAVSSGEIVCSNSDGSLRKFRSNPSSTNVTFADIDTGAEASSTTYYIYSVCDADAETATFKISLSSSAPDSITYYKRIGSFYNDSSSNILNDETVTNDNNYYGLVLGDWVSKTIGTSYLATTDGDVVVWGTENSESDARLEGYTGPASTPTTKRVSNSTATGSPSNLGFSMPVKKGDYYRVVKTNCCGTDSAMYFIPSQ